MEKPRDEMHPSIGMTDGEFTTFNTKLYNASKNERYAYLNHLKDILIEQEETYNLLGLADIVHGQDGLSYTLHDGLVHVIGRWTNDLLPKDLVIVAESVNVTELEIHEVANIYLPYYQIILKPEESRIINKLPNTLCQASEICI